MPVIPSARSLTIATDGDQMSFSGRIRLRGQDELSLFPALFTLELWNLPEESALRISRCRSVAVSHEDACLVSGSVSDVYRHATPEGILTSVSISLGLDLWESIASLNVPAGTTVSETIRQILAASGTGIPLLSFPESDPVSFRGQSFFGRAAESITSVLSAVSSRPMLTPSGLMVVSAEQGAQVTVRPALDSAFARSTNVEPQNRDSTKAPLEPLPRRSAIRITEKDLTDTPAFVSGGKIMILSATVSGWRPGQTVEVEYKNIHARGIVTARSVDADTAAGPWNCEMIVEVLNR